MMMRFSDFDVAGARPAMPDYPALAAALAASRARSRTARLARGLKLRQPVVLSSVAALAALFGGDRRVAGAVVTLGGSFHPAVAAALGRKGF